VKRMSELPKYVNLFRHKGAGGVGGVSFSPPTKGKQDVAKLARTDIDAYIKGRKDGSIKL